MKKLYLLILVVISCNNSQKVTDNTHYQFEDEINRYNYLDKEHDLAYVYDFEKLLKKNEVEEIKSKLKTSRAKTGITGIVVIENDMDGKDFDRQIKILNGIFKKKFNLDKVYILKINPQNRQIGIATDNELLRVIPDSVSMKLIKQTLIPHFKNKQFSKGIIKIIKQIDSLSQIH